jgi:hypothetical protein
MIERPIYLCAEPAQTDMPNRFEWVVEKARFRGYDDVRYEGQNSWLG